MLTRIQFDRWFADYKARFPAVGDYASRQKPLEPLIDCWHQSLAAFDLETLQAVTAAIIAGSIDPIPNTQLGQFGNEIRQRARQVLEQGRRHEEPEWKETGRWSPSKALREPRMSHMLACAKAVNRLLGVETPIGSTIDPRNSSYDAAIVMADDHTAEEERLCLEAFRYDGLTWQQVCEEAARDPGNEVLRKVREETHEQN